MDLTAYRTMWLVVMFDLPVTTKAAKKAYTRFRKFLLQDGYSQMQFSVYTRHCASRENAQVHIDRVEAAVPHDGEVRIVAVTEKQFEQMHVFWGKSRLPVADVPRQLELF